MGRSPSFLPPVRRAESPDYYGGREISMHREKIVLFTDAVRNTRVWGLGDFPAFRHSW
jgi:hypothetical protein